MNLEEILLQRIADINQFIAALNAKVARNECTQANAQPILDYQTEQLQKAENRLNEIL